MGRVSEIVAVLLIAQTCIGNPTGPSDSQLVLGQVYFNFSANLLDTLEKSEAASPIPKTPVGSSTRGVDADSIFGLGNILAIANEKPWPITVPIFDSFLGNSSQSVAAAFEFVISQITQDPDVQVSNTIFTPEKLSLTPNLSKLKVDVVSSDLKSKDAVTTINSNISKKLISPLEDSYIPKDSTISPAAKALIVNTLQFSGNWPSAAKKLSSGAKFNGVDVEMIELSGKFQVLEFKQGVQVILPFKNEKRGLSLVLPNNFAAALKSEDPDDQPPKLVNATSVRLQIPVFKVTLRVLENSGYSKCDFPKSDNFLQLLDEVTYFSLSAEKLEAISITGAQVNSVSQFKQELGRNSSRAFSASPAVSNSAADAVPAQKGADTSTAAKGSTDERLIVFNKPFTWTVLDVDLGPLFAGSVSSLDFLKKVPVAAPKSNSVFGVRDDLPYSKCL